MTQEEKQLLLVDLCTRASYGVNCLFKWSYINETTGGEEVIAEQIDTINSINFHTKEVEANYYGEWVGVEDCKPYLRPMSSMTEEEFDEFSDIIIPVDGGKAIVEEENSYKYVDFCNAHHFDYRGLIEKGLALEAPEGMYHPLN